MGNKTFTASPKYLFAKFILFIALILNHTHVSAQSLKEKTSPVDTFKAANKLIAKKKFRKANNLLNEYHKHHPKDFNSVWQQAQTKFWLTNFRKSDTLYKTAVKLKPDNDYLRLNYISSLADMGKMAQAQGMLSDMEFAGRDYPYIDLLHAKLNYYQGNYKKASAYMRKALQSDNKTDEANNLDDAIALAKAPKVGLSSAYLSDNQPVTALISTLRAENYFNKALDLYLVCDEYHFTQNTVSDAPWVRIGDKLFFPQAGLRINVGGGLFKFPTKNGVDVSGNLSINEKLSQHFDIDVAVDEVPYLDTKTSIDSNITATRFSAMLNWHMRSWSAQVAFLNSTYPDNNNVYSVYGWVLAPIAHFPNGGGLQLGLSSSYGNANQNTFSPAYPITYSSNGSIPGIYNPYFTPDNQYITSALLAMAFNFSKAVSLNINADYGYGTIKNPYLYLSTDKVTVVKGYSNENFQPYNATVALNYHIDKTWLLSAKYIYHNTYFFTSNYVSLGLEKSFIRSKKKLSDKSASNYSRLIDEIEGEIQSLYKYSSIEDLKGAVASIRSKAVSLRDAQKSKRNSREMLADSDEAATLKERYESLNDMINDLDAVNLDDFKQANVKKKEWLMDKLYELTSISYNGSRE